MVQAIRSRGKKVELDESQKQRVVQLYQGGKGYTDISEETGLSRWTLALVLKEAGVSVSKGRKRTRKERRVPASSEKKTIRRTEKKGEVNLSASELSSMIAAAEEEARKYKEEIDNYIAELGKLWERAEYLSAHEEALAQALAAVRVMGDKVKQYEKQISETQQRSMQRALAVHSDTKNLSRE